MGSLPHGYRHTTTRLGVVWLKQDPDGDPLHLALVVHCAPLQHGQVWQSGEGFPGREALSGASVCSVLVPGIAVSWPWSIWTEEDWDGARQPLLCSSTMQVEEVTERMDYRAMKGREWVLAAMR